MIPVSLTLARHVGHVYQVTYWSDGTARWDAQYGPRCGAWQSKVPVEWFLRAALFGASVGAPANMSPANGTVVVEFEGSRVSHEFSDGEETDLLWALASILDGMATRTPWVPFDVSGLRDLAPWGRGTCLNLSRPGCFARALALPQGLVVLAGSQFGAATSPSLEPSYRSLRNDLLDSKELVLSGEAFVLTRHLAFGPPSAAASVVIGSNANGRHDWRDESGRSWALLSFEDPVEGEVTG